VATVAVLVVAATAARADQLPVTAIHDPATFPVPGDQTTAEPLPAAPPAATADSSSTTHSNTTEAAPSPPAGSTQTALSPPATTTQPAASQPQGTTRAAPPESAGATEATPSAVASPNATQPPPQIEPASPDPTPVSRSNTATQTIWQVQSLGCRYHCEGLSQNQSAKQKNTTVEVGGSTPQPPSRSQASSEAERPQQSVTTLSQVQLGCLAHCFGNTTTAAGAQDPTQAIAQFLGAAVPVLPAQQPASGAQQSVVDQMSYQSQDGGDLVGAQTQSAEQVSTTLQTTSFLASLADFTSAASALASLPTDLPSLFPRPDQQPTGSSDPSQDQVVNQIEQGIWQLQIGCLAFCSQTQQGQKAEQSDTTIWVLSPTDVPAAAPPTDQTDQLVWQLQVGCLFWCYDAVETQTAAILDQIVTLVSPSSPTDAQPPVSTPAPAVPPASSPAVPSAPAITASASDATWISASAGLVSISSAAAQAPPILPLQPGIIGPPALSLPTSSPRAPTRQPAAGAPSTPTRRDTNTVRRFGETLSAAPTVSSVTRSPGRRSARERPPSARTTSQPVDRLLGPASVQHDDSAIAVLGLIGLIVLVLVTRELRRERTHAASTRSRS
jgi:hypothetical protein